MRCPDCMATLPGDGSCCDKCGWVMVGGGDDPRRPSKRTFDELQSEIERRKTALFDKQWEHATAGLDRAVVWIKANKKALRGGFHLFLNRETGIEIGFCYLNNDEAKVIHRLFKGKTATRTIDDDGDEHFRLVDAGLTFTWEILTDRPARKAKTAEVTIGVDMKEAVRQSRLANREDA